MAKQRSAAGPKAPPQISLVTHGRQTRQVLATGAVRAADTVAAIRS